MPGSDSVRRAVVATVLAAVVASVGAGCAAGTSDGAGDVGAGPVTIGLVTKTDSNPYFVRLRASAEAEAARKGAKVIALAGRFDGDNDGQVAAIQQLIAKRVKGILITPSNSSGVLGAIKAAQRAGIVVIALDTATDPASAVSATYATDNYKAGEILGEYVQERMGSTAPQLVTMDLGPSASVGQQRHNGFLRGMGLRPDSPAIIGSALTEGDQRLARRQMAHLLHRVAGRVNAVYSINEPAARGAAEALAAQGLTGRVLVGTIDGGCDGVRDVKKGTFAATVMQFPKKMAEDGVDAVVTYAKTGAAPSRDINTGATLITDHPVTGIASKDTAWGATHCWG